MMVTRGRRWKLVEVKRLGERGEKRERGSKRLSLFVLLYLFLYLFSLVFGNLFTGCFVVSLCQ